MCQFCDGFSLELSLLDNKLEISCSENKASASFPLYILVENLILWNDILLVALSCEVDLNSLTLLV